MPFFQAQIDGRSFDLAYIHRPRSEELVVFFHGIACTKNTFRYLYNEPLLEDYSLLFYDMVGFGDSSKPDDFGYAMEDQALICQQLLGQFSYNKLHLVAHSMGSAVALLLAPEILSRLGSFANLEGNLIGEDCYFTRKMIQHDWRDYKAIVFAKQRRKFTDNILFEYDRTTPQAIYNTAESLVSWSDSNDLLNRFYALSCTRAYFVGDKTQDLVVLSRLQDIPIITIPDSGHAMMIDNPAKFNEILARFIHDSGRDA